VVRRSAVQAVIDAAGVLRRSKKVPMPTLIHGYVVLGRAAERALRETGWSRDRRVAETAESVSQATLSRAIALNRRHDDARLERYCATARSPTLSAYLKWLNS
jgi:hypothetical protein